MKLRKAIVDDLSQLVELEQILFTGDAYSKQSLLEELKNDNRLLYVATKAEMVVGYIIVNVLPDLFEVMKIGVLPNYQRQGVASQLLQFFLQQLKQQRFKIKVQLEVKSSNLSALAFYKKMGFEKLYVRKNYYKTCDAYVLQLQQ